MHHRTYDKHKWVQFIRCRLGFVRPSREWSRDYRQRKQGTRVFICRARQCKCFCTLRRQVELNSVVISSDDRGSEARRFDEVQRQVTVNCFSPRFFKMSGQNLWNTASWNPVSALRMQLGMETEQVPFLQLHILGMSWMLHVSCGKHCRQI